MGSVATPQVAALFGQDTTGSVIFHTLSKLWKSSLILGK